ncbi:alpha/beta hydrolase fold domain-containing protein [Antrihabitans sp. YC3-6]|uniref:Alpha/beta hydrolase fold domain-containing protein n=1 Tax=Antrihabitans stalagmiti TaxID=2799499 RepID=A0A934U646_9NOCA|nr:alpha/beta hydrolase [Antrihabitans stalagmiti]MBJ8342121.1 alpha/beta hydrolase fold domain-containing protein [Antrihabitans stalagmiti]
MSTQPLVSTAPSLQSQAVHATFRLVVRPVLQRIPVNGWPVVLAATVESAAKVLPPPSGVTVEKVCLARFDAEIVRPSTGPMDLRRGAVLYLHGGAFLVGGLNSHRPVVAAIARRTGLAVMHVAYRQLPDAPISGSVEDCVMAYRWLVNRGVDPARIVIAGDSAGGFLAFATALAAPAAGLGGPAALIGFSPWLDLDCATKLAHPNNDSDAYLPAKLLAAVGGSGGTGPNGEALPSPVDGALSGLPPVLLIAVDSEVLFVDSELMAARLDAAGVPCTLRIWKGQIHAFTTLFPWLPESRAALDDAASFIISRIGAAPVPSIEHPANGS